MAGVHPNELAVEEVEVAAEDQEAAELVDDAAFAADVGGVV